MIGRLKRFTTLLGCETGLRLIPRRSVAWLHTLEPSRTVRQVARFNEPAKPRFITHPSSYRGERGVSSVYLSGKMLNTDNFACRPRRQRPVRAPVLVAPRVKPLFAQTTVPARRRIPFQIETPPHVVRPAKALAPRVPALARFDALSRDGRSMRVWGALERPVGISSPKAKGGRVPCFRRWDRRASQAKKTHCRPAARGQAASEGRHLSARASGWPALPPAVQ